VKKFNEENFIVAFVIISLCAIFVLYALQIKKSINDPNYITNKKELTEEYVDQKIAHAVDSVLKAVSKTDRQLLDLILEKQNKK
jgi:Ca2+/Na+ antiporter